MEFFSSSLPLFFGRADELEPALPLSLDDFRLWLKEVVASFCLVGSIMRTGRSEQEEFFSLDKCLRMV